jgi:hypothetical protein
MEFTPMETSHETPTKAKASRAKASAPKPSSPPTTEAYIIDYVGTKSEVNKALEHLALTGYSLSGITLSKNNSGIAEPIYTALGIVTKLA